MSKTLYTVSSGSYSDYQVLAVFDRKTDADAAIRTLKGLENYPHDFRVETLPYFAAKETPEVVTWYYIQENWWDDGSKSDYDERIYTESEINSLWGVPGQRPKLRWVRAPMHKNKGGRIEISARSLELARKVHSEREAMWKADDPFYRSTERNELAS